MADLNAVLDYWFGDNPDDLAVINQYGKLWFGKDAQVDQELQDRFGHLVKEIGAEQIEIDSQSPRATLAKVILLDQFTRNIFRGRAEAFAYDPVALALAENLINCGAEQSLRPLERVFLYLPLEHSENLTHQEHCVKLYRALIDAVPPGWRKSFSGFLDYAVRHRDIVVRFGRFPHRNSILGRESTPEELSFLQQPGSSF